MVGELALERARRDGLDGVSDQSLLEKVAVLPGETFKAELVLGSLACMESYLRYLLIALLNSSEFRGDCEQVLAKTKVDVARLDSHAEKVLIALEKALKERVPRIEQAVELWVLDAARAARGSALQSARVPVLEVASSLAVRAGASMPSNAEALAFTTFSEIGAIACRVLGRSADQGAGKKLQADFNERLDRIRDLRNTLFHNRRAGMDALGALAEDIKQVLKAVERAFPLQRLPDAAE